MKSTPITLLLAVCAVAFASPRASAQIRPGDCGMLLVSGAGSYGNMCRGFTCTPFPASVAPNEKVTLLVRGPKDAPFWLFVAPRAKFCLPVPPLQNSLILTPPVFLVAAGTLGEQDFIRACPGGLKTLRFPVPLPRGSRFAMQSIIMARWLQGPLPTLTSAIDVAVK